MTFIRAVEYRNDLRILTVSNDVEIYFQYIYEIYVEIPKVYMFR